MVLGTMTGVVTAASVLVAAVGSDRITNEILKVSSPFIFLGFASSSIVSVSVQSCFLSSRAVNVFFSFLRQRVMSPFFRALLSPFFFILL